MIEDLDAGKSEGMIDSKREEILEGDDLCSNAIFYHFYQPGKFFLDLSNIVSKLLLNAFHSFDLSFQLVSYIS